MRKIIYAIFCIILIAAVLIVKNAFEEGKIQPRINILPANHEIKLIVATDMHYLASNMLEPYSPFHQALRRGDGKTPHYSPQIMDAFIDEVIRINPQALILSGDISFNGERASHMELAQKLRKVREHGIPVLVIPGNHDINSSHAYQFLNNRTRPTLNISAKDFWKTYSPLGAKNAIAFDKTTLSYVYQISKDLQIMMIDTSQYQEGNVKTGGIINEKTLIWIEKNLLKAKKKGTIVITVTHHSLLPHSALFNSNFTINNYTEVLQILEKYEVPVNLSGHIHIQHIKRSNETEGIYDIATNAMAVYPNHYGILDISADKSILYTTHKVNVSEFAKNSNSDDENLLNFEKYSFDFMTQTSFQRMLERLSSYNINAQQRQAMVEFVQMLNTHYFAGTPLNITEEDQMYRLWLEYFPSGFHTRYLRSIMTDSETQSATLFIPSIFPYSK